MADALGPGVFSSFIKWLFSSGDISVPSEYHERCEKIREMLDNDVSGIINTVLDYAVDSASDAKYKIQCSNETLQKILNEWIGMINIEIPGVPAGLQSLSKEYFKERWEGSSFCVLRVKDWATITIDNVSVKVPTTMWFVNGSSVYVNRPDEKNFKLGSDKYFLDNNQKISIPENKEENIIIQKPFNRWFDQYATPYLIKRGVYKNWLGIKILQEKSDEVISKVLPYLFLIKKGTEKMFLEGDVDYSDDELKEQTENFKKSVEEYKNQKGKTPTNSIPFDTSYEHLMPDLGKVLKEELYRQGYRAILSGLGFIDMLEIAPSRQESRLNPKAFIAEINDGVGGFKSILLEVITLIEQKNKGIHPKLFTDKGRLTIINSPLKINVEQILADVRGGFDRGPISITSYLETLGFDPETEIENRVVEANRGLEDTMYPHVIQNMEDKGKDIIIPSKPKTKKQENLEDEGKKPNSPEAKDFKNAEISLEMAPYDKDNPPDFLKKYPKEARDAFIETFNKLLKEGKPEEYCFPVAWNSLKRVMKKLKEEKK